MCHSFEECYMNNYGVIFKSLTLKNCRGYENVVFPLDNQGLVSIQGDNGAGKSTFGDILEAIIYGSTPTGFKKDELVIDQNDAEMCLHLMKNNENVLVTLQRKSKKWSYDIKVGNEPKADHNYFDAIKTITNFVGLSKDEFEGAVHLAQNSQHKLIKGTLSERKDYISAFFGIDNRYDEVLFSAKEELDKVTNKIQNLSGLSHTQQMLMNELSLSEIKDLTPLQEKIKVWQLRVNTNIAERNDNEKVLETWKTYKQYENDAFEFSNPETLEKEIENKIVETQSKAKAIHQIKLRNEQARKNNGTIDDLQKRIDLVLGEYPGLKMDTSEVQAYETELNDLINLKRQNQNVSTLREELKILPNVKEVPIKKIEEELVNLQVAYQTHLKNKTAKEKGICTECGSKFTIQDVQSEIEIIKELKGNVDELSKDYGTIKQRNQNVSRRKWILDQLNLVPEFSQENENRILFLTAYIKSKKMYEDLLSKIKMFTRMEVENIDENIPSDLEDRQILERIKRCIFAKKSIPVKPSYSEEELLKQKNDLHAKAVSYKTTLDTLLQDLGESRTANDVYTKNRKQLENLNNQLTELDSLKKKEFFWSKVVEAYGPKGLRVVQLEKMMDLVIKQLPVYVSILFNEKNLSFKHKVDANNVKILACREKIKAEEPNLKFQHDIGCFSGGEKHKMSASFILTLTDCIPVHKKPNILILDEVDSDLDADGKFRFTNDLLPMLKKKYSSIFVISHDKEVQLANIYDQIWHISKNNHESKLDIKVL